MRVVIIGNSHVGAVAKALAAAPAEPGLDIEFLAAPAKRLANNLRIEGATAQVCLRNLSRRAVLPPDIDASGRLDLGRYDRIVLFGFQLLSSGTGGKWADVVRHSSRPYSSALWQAYAIDGVRATEHYRIASEITDADVRARTLSLPCPLPSALNPRLRGIKGPANRRIREFLDIAGAEMNRLGVRFHHLPAELLDPNGYATDARFKNSKDDDFSHLNEAGGRVVLDFIRRLAAAPAAA